MDSTKNLESILNDLHFTEDERKGFLKTVDLAREYMKNPNADLEKSFKEVVEKVMSHEI